MLHQLSTFLHINKVITNSLSFTDLLNCVMVSHAWNDNVSPILYLEVTAFPAPMCPQEN